MITFYVLQIKMGKMAIEDVPELWRNEVKVQMEVSENAN